MPNEQESLMETAKRMHNELSTEPLAAHNTVIQMMNILLQHRATVEQAKAQEQAQRDQMAAHLGMAQANQRPRIV